MHVLLALLANSSQSKMHMCSMYYWLNRKYHQKGGPYSSPLTTGRVVVVTALLEEVVKTLANTDPFCIQYPSAEKVNILETSVLVF